MEKHAMVDIVVIGCGPAGLSAAISARHRNQSVLVLSNRPEENIFFRAERVDNYLGLPGQSGESLMKLFLDHAATMDVVPVTGRVLTLLPMGNQVFVSYGSEVAEAGAAVLATGVVRAEKLPGEAVYLGRGLSYCATCDGMLYRGRTVVVTGDAPDTAEEAGFLLELGCQVTFVGEKRPENLREEISFVQGKPMEIVGEQTVTGLRTKDALLPCQGVFLLRKAIAAEDLLPGLETKDSAIVVNRRMETSVPGVFAAGDCTGWPFQIAKAVGEGLIAGQCAAEYLNRKKK